MSKVTEDPTNLYYVEFRNVVSDGEDTYIGAYVIAKKHDEAVDKVLSDLNSKFEPISNLEFKSISLITTTDPCIALGKRSRLYL
ncbi:MAG: hypothetical protein PHI24_09120 [Desulfitobacteriaceae bacterium]|nr:hypothetical protein [Desulfitobacteriaceae bacterium]